MVGTDWFRFFDVAQQWINQSQNYSAMAYLPYTFVASHLLFAASNTGRLKFPTSHSEATAATQKANNTVEALVADMGPSAR